MRRLGWVPRVLLIRHFRTKFEMRLEGIGHALKVGVTHVVFFANLFDLRRHVIQMHVIESREKVMLDLETEAAGDREPYHAPDGISARVRRGSVHLVFKPVRVTVLEPTVGIFLVDVVDVGIGHENCTVDHAWDRGKCKGFQEAEFHEGPTSQQKRIDNTA